MSLFFCLVVGHMTRAQIMRIVGTSYRARGVA